MIYNAERPISFDQMIGQEMVVENIRNQSIRGSFFPVFILCGQYGSGKTTMARIISMAANCEHKDEKGNPCGTCDSCMAVLNHSSEGIIEVDGASNNGVESIRKLLEQAAVLGIYNKKIIVIDEAHKLSNAAFNALLITLENPPAHCIFILCTTEKDALPDTIVSRAPVYNFSKISDELIKKHVLEVAKKNKIAISEDAAGILARYSNGAMRNALQLLEHLSLQKLSGEEIIEDDVVKILGLSSMEQRAAFLDSILSANISETIKILRSCEKSGRSIRTFMQDVLAMNTDLLLHIAGSEMVGTKFYKTKLQELSAFESMDIVRANKMLSTIAATPVNLLSTERIVADIVSVVYEKVAIVKVPEAPSLTEKQTKKVERENLVQQIDQKSEEAKESVKERLVNDSEKELSVQELSNDGFCAVTNDEEIPFEVVNSEEEPENAKIEEQSAGVFDSFSFFGGGFFDAGFIGEVSTKPEKKEDTLNLLESPSVAGNSSGRVEREDSSDIIEAKTSEIEEYPPTDCKKNSFKDSYPPNLEGRMRWDEAAKLGIVHEKEELNLPKPETEEELDAMYEAMEDTSSVDEEVETEDYVSKKDLLAAREELARLLKNPGFKILYNKAREVEENNQIHLYFDSQSLVVAVKIFLKGVENIIVHGSVS